MKAKKKPKFKVGDKVIVISEEIKSDMYADMLSEVTDGSMTRRGYDNVCAALQTDSPLTICGIESLVNENGYVLKYGRTELYGVYDEQDLCLASERKVNAGMTVK